MNHSKLKSNGSEISREKTIVQTSIIGIIANVFLAAFKAVVGILAHSIAIVLDAVNNISDAGSSLITIVGTKLAGKEPDKKHPFGYGRIEYMSAMRFDIVVSFDADDRKAIYSEVVSDVQKAFPDILIISRSGKHRYAGRKAAARKEESSKTHKESGNSPCEIPSYIIGLEAQPQY